MRETTRILIVDDIVDNIQVAMNILKEEHYDFSFATQGKEALVLLEEDKERFDLILLDVMMPGLDGFEVCRRIKANPQIQDIPIIFLTAKVDVDAISKAFSLGAVDYITKPFHADELLARVKSHIQLFHAKQLLQQHNIVLATKVRYEHKRLLTELENNQKELIYMLTELMEATSDETGKHIRRIAEFSSLLAYFHPSLSEEDADILLYASPMHDIGKITIPHEVLHKPGRYTEAEFQVMQAHTTNAYNLLCCSERKLFKAAAVIAHEHHEKWNGTGYPRQLKGADIHIYGRIVALADVFDALTHTRCYKPAWKVEEAISYIQEHRGTQFDPELVDIMLKHIDEFKLIAQKDSAL
ncbi:MAG: putative two-component system response regulator [Methyloprofundus sp.]|nr:MAG: putative two-component system response regulator [Methyloprofundus sp.]